ncbi:MULTISPECIES: hypothetical protein [Psychrobacter]|jgi:hypothetical protein|uniref:Uncharacterized protein n=2 Tax=Psychrobacter TaxID=497 RepID=A0A1G6VZC8_9GAMM|nr:MULTISPECIES: hypothetical protein [Psychrobacter]HBL95896.1 hypothetical protein [Psychrobacter sp.]MDH4904460.1 hypothetical protein [Psychrobacter pocilloporae]SDD58874.1 hypothetical protein SAMN05660405_00775 [Psychrobacter pacificensis]BBI68534.1 hypothetical protein PKHYL_27250 [Psychrobacter sp. KH172YL61]GLR28836.1 hypothetical protein GCM10007915_10740 [Psychrobacter pacificensis]
MDSGMVGSQLTRLMLENGHQEIWCAVSDVSDEDAMEDQVGNDFTACIVDFRDGQFYCTADNGWFHAVPIEVRALTQNEVGF